MRARGHVQQMQREFEILRALVPSCQVSTLKPRLGNSFASSLSDLKEIGCKSAWTVHISLPFWAIEELLPSKIIKIWPRPVDNRYDFSSPTGC